MNNIMKFKRKMKYRSLDSIGCFDYIKIFFKNIFTSCCPCRSNKKFRDKDYINDNMYYINDNMYNIPEGHEM